jgi:3-isopropylmalate/(R)-2-methylmalate dehydratase small subunit
MEKVIKGKAFVFGSNVDTDQIYPGRYLELTDPTEIGRHAMEGADPAFVEEFEQGDVIIAATNFGCGSSREQAAITLKAVGVGAILAESFGRIFYRNAVNLGIPVLIASGVSETMGKGDILIIDIVSGRITNETTGATTQAQPLSEYVMTILESGGIKALIRKQVESGVYGNN